MKTAYAESDQKASKIDKNLVARNTRFALNILKELQKEDEKKNIFISPLSILTALAMIYNGAESLTRDAMAETLQIKEMSLTEINEGYRNLIDSLENVESQVSLNIGNSIWIRKSFEPSIKIGFKDALTKYFKSEILPRQFSDPKTVDEINAWVKRETTGKIDKIIDNIDRGTLMFLISAIYFKGDWTKKFDESKTRQRSFYLQNGKKISVAMMSNIEKILYYSDDSVQVARLPYGRDKLAMYVLLPNEGVDLGSFIQTLEQEKLDRILARMKMIEIELQLPKLKLEYGKKQLNGALIRLGMGVAFGESADLKGIASVDPENLSISFVDHKAVVEVNEKGTEAAAVTNIGIRSTQMLITTHRFVVNRPYLFVIRDDRSGSILFMGKILDPTQHISP
ncbi:MAG: serpin family protein [Candidatus Bathyarchaeota archaeon]|nr:serpin family protein [Candidatus Bathyarchaeota archaeon]